MATNQRSVRCVLMRGGTSKGVFLNENDVPREPAARDSFILALMGSPDPRQIDELGGADYLTSKVAIIGPGAPHGADVAYTFAQVGTEQAWVTYFTNCGNLSAAVGVYAIEEGLVPAVEPVTRVRIYNTNTKKQLVSYVPVVNGLPVIEGDFAIAGVPGRGAEIRMDYSQTIGANTGKLFPTGNVRDMLEVPELDKAIAVTIIDVAKANVFFRADDVGIAGTEGPDGFTREVCDRFWAVRNAAARLIGLATETRLPTPVSVMPPTDYIDFMTKREIRADEMSFVARRVNGPPPVLHKAMAGTGAIPAGVAAMTPGTVIHEVAHNIADGMVRIGHPTGIFPVRIDRDADGSLREASFSRTARRLMEGLAFLPARASSPTGIVAAPRGIQEE